MLMPPVHLANQTRYSKLESYPKPYSPPVVDRTLAMKRETVVDRPPVRDRVFSGNSYVANIGFKNSVLTDLLDFLTECEAYSYIARFAAVVTVVLESVAGRGAGFFEIVDRKGICRPVHTPVLFDAELADVYFRNVEFSPPVPRMSDPAFAKRAFDLGKCRPFRQNAIRWTRARFCKKGPA